MIGFEQINNHVTDFPERWSFLGSPEEAATIQKEHKDQILFLDTEASRFIEEYILSAKMITGPLWRPFNKRYFRTVEEFVVTENCDAEIKKWLFNKEIPFDHFVFIAFDRSGSAIKLTWKMVIKYWEGLFFADDLIIFDQSLNWGLFYFHEDVLFFGSDKIYDKEFEYEKALELNRLKEKYFQKRTDAPDQKYMDRKKKEFLRSRKSMELTGCNKLLVDSAVYVYLSQPT